jgi:uncharacterized glyoxalase superfamily protein PhnB
MADTDSSPAPTTAPFDIRLELVILPVTDIDAAKAFYVDQVGFVADHDVTVSDDIRFVQLTPPGSAASVAFGKGLTDAAAGTVKGLQVVVEDAEAVYAHLVARGVQASPVQDLAWGRFTGFSDPDGNTWAVQQLPPRD